MSIHLVLLNWTLDGLLEAHSTRCSSKMVISISQNLVTLFSQLNSVLGKTYETQQEPQLAYSCKSAISFILNGEEFPPLLSACGPLGSLTQLNVRTNSQKICFSH